jgi:hypothetical protein
LPRNDGYVPQRHHLDRRAGELAAASAAPPQPSSPDPDQLLTTAQVAQWIGVSKQWLEIGRRRGYGPRYSNISPRRTRYCRGDVVAWLQERMHRAGEYNHRADAAE